MQKMLGLMPGMGEMREMLNQVDAEKDMKPILFGIIDSMTPEEKRNPTLIREEVSRRQHVSPRGRVSRTMKSMT